MSNLERAGWRCCQCGRLDANSNQPCVEHGDVEPVYRVVEGAVGDLDDPVDPSETSDPMTFLTPREIRVLRKVLSDAQGSRETDDPEFEIIGRLRDRLYP